MTQTTIPSAFRKALAPLAAASLMAASLLFSVSPDALGFGTNSVGSLPNMADDGKGDHAPLRLDPSFYVRGPKEFFKANKAVLDEAGEGMSYDLVEVDTGWIRREYRGQVFLTLDLRLIQTGQVEVGVLAGERSPMRFLTLVDGLSGEGQTLRMDSALELPIGDLSERGLLDHRFELHTLQMGRARGGFTMQRSEDVLKVMQDQ